MDQLSIYINSLASYFRYHSCDISKLTGWAIIEELSMCRQVRTFMIRWGQKTLAKHCYVDLSSWYELWFAIICIDMNVILDLSTTIHQFGGGFDHKYGKNIFHIISHVSCLSAVMPHGSYSCFVIAQPLETHQQKSKFLDRAQVQDISNNNCYLLSHPGIPGLTLWPTGDAPTTSEWSSLLPAKVPLILEVPSSL